MAIDRSLMACGFLSQILPYFDEGLERLYAFLRNLSSKLPRPGDGAKFTLDDDVALKFFRLQQVGRKGPSSSTQKGAAATTRSTVNPTG